MNVRDTYEVEVNYELDQLSKTTELGSDEHKKAADAIFRLTEGYIRLKEVDNEERRIAIEEVKAENEKEKITLERDKLATELQKIADEQQDKKIKRKLDIIIAGLKVLGLIGVSVIVLGFEKNGTLVISKPGNKLVDMFYRMF